MTVNFKCKIGAYSIMLKFWVPCSAEMLYSVKPVKAGEQYLSGPLQIVEGTPSICSLSVPVDPLRQPNGVQYHPRQKEGIQSKSDVFFALSVPGTVRTNRVAAGLWPMKRELGLVRRRFASQRPTDLCR